MTKIWERLYLGSLRDAERLAAANPLGIKAVVTLCEERVEQRAAGIDYVQIPIADAQLIPAQALEEALFAIAVGVRMGKLLVHCAGGVSRAPIITAAWMQRCGYAEFHRALAEIAELRDLDLSPLLLRSVKELLNR